MPAGRTTANEAVANQYTWATFNPTVEASPDYSAGDSVGGLLTITNAVRDAYGCCVLEKITVIDQADQKQPIDFLFFSLLPTTTLTENGAVDIADADMEFFEGHVRVAAANYQSASDNAVATLKDINLPLKVHDTNTLKTTLYCIPIAQGTINFAAATDLRITFMFKQAI